MKFMPTSILEYLHHLRFRLLHGGADAWSIELADSGIRVLRNDLVTEELPWGDIENLVLRRVDMVTYERIQLLAGLTSSKSFMVHELMKGWSELMRELDHRFACSTSAAIRSLNAGSATEALWSRPNHLSGTK